MSFRQSCPDLVENAFTRNQDLLDYLVSGNRDKMNIIPELDQRILNILSYLSTILGQA